MHHLKTGNGTADCWVAALLTLESKKSKQSTDAIREGATVGLRLAECLKRVVAASSVPSLSRSAGPKQCLKGVEATPCPEVVTKTIQPCVQGVGATPNIIYASMQGVGATPNTSLATKCASTIPENVAVLATIKGMCTTPMNMVRLMTGMERVGATPRHTACTQCHAGDVNAAEATP